MKTIQKEISGYPYYVMVGERIIGHYKRAAVAMSTARRASGKAHRWR